MQEKLVNHSVKNVASESKALSESTIATLNTYRLKMKLQKAFDSIADATTMRVIFAEFLGSYIS